MEGILHQLECIKPYENWDVFQINWCRMFSIKWLDRVGSCKSKASKTLGSGDCFASPGSNITEFPGYSWNQIHDFPKKYVNYLVHPFWSKLIPNLIFRYLSHVAQFTGTPNPTPLSTSPSWPHTSSLLNEDLNPWKMSRRTSTSVGHQKMTWFLDGFCGNFRMPFRLRIF